jgi:hypothetical protein
MLVRSFTLLLVISAMGAAVASQSLAPQSSTPRLPDTLSENETQLILKEGKPKSHVDATFKVGEARLTQALRLARDSQYPESAQNLDLYEDLVIYADAYARRATRERTKERTQTLKLIEQRIFRQSSALDSLARELPSTYSEISDRVVSTVKRVRLRALDEAIGSGDMLKSSTDLQP